MKTETIVKSKNFAKTFGILCLILVFGGMTNTAQAQSTERTVTGVVKTLDDVVPGAAIVLKGTNIGVAADDHGAFTFPKPLKEHDVLIVSSMAFDDIEVTIGSNTTFIEPYLEGNPVVIIASLRTAPSKNVVGSPQD